MLNFVQGRPTSQQRQKEFEDYMQQRQYLRKDDPNRDPEKEAGFTGSGKSGRQFAQEEFEDYMQQFDTPEMSNQGLQRALNKAKKEGNKEIYNLAKDMWTGNRYHTMKYIPSDGRTDNFEDLYDPNLKKINRTAKQLKDDMRVLNYSLGISDMGGYAN